MSKETAVQQQGEFFRPANVQKEQFFKKISEIRLTRGLKIGVYGEPETGKSYFGLTCPAPVYVNWLDVSLLEAAVPSIHSPRLASPSILDTELAAAKLAKQHFPSKDINVCEVKVVNPETMLPDPVRSMYEMEQAIVSLKDVKEGTIVVDNATEVYWQPGLAQNAGSLPDFWVAQ